LNSKTSSYDGVKTHNNKLFTNSAIKSKLIKNDLNNNKNFNNTNPTTKLSSTSVVSFNQKLTNTTTTAKSNNSYVSNRFLKPSVLINSDKYVNKSYRAERLLRVSNKSPVYKKSVSTSTGSSLVSNTNQNRSYFTSATNLNETKLAVITKSNYF
jgi:hypothetical protein